MKKRKVRSETEKMGNLMEQSRAEKSRTEEGRV